MAIAALLTGSFCTARAETSAAVVPAATQAVSSSVDASTPQTQVAADNLPAAPYSSSVEPAANPNASAAIASAQNGPYVRPGSGPAPSDYSRFLFAAGAGFNAPAGSTAHYQTWGWGLQLAGGMNLNRLIGAEVKYDYDYTGIPGWILRAENPYGGGDVHTWSISFDPVINLPSRGRGGAYILGGPGFYRKVTEFTQPLTGCFYYCYAYSAVIDHWSNNAFGADLGAGLTWKASRWNNMKYFAEARYVWIDNQSSSNNTAQNGYPPANYRTGYFPVTFGVRW